MFITIQPQDHQQNLDKISAFLALVKRYPSISLSEEEKGQATYIIAHDAARGVYGGAVLVQKRSHLFPRKRHSNVVNFSAFKAKGWTCELFLHMENDDPLFQNDDFESFCQEFYTDLYAQLDKFGLENGTEFIYTTLDPSEHLCTEMMGAWPYVMELKPQDSLDGLFHGVLSLGSIKPDLTVSQSPNYEFSSVQKHIAA